jgi:Asp-tRNA(Asn)/Glu-tRNA(Gln) amidotransferase A subunit family amidase
MENLSACEIADAVRTRRLSAHDVVEAALKRTDERNAALNAFVTLDAEGARANAKATTTRLSMASCWIGTARSWLVSGHTTIYRVAR